jgi:hypothetical protein
MPAGQDLMQAFMFRILIKVIYFIMDSGSTRMDIIGIMAVVYFSMIRNGIPIGRTIGKHIPAIIGSGTDIMETIAVGTKMIAKAMNGAKKTGKEKERMALTETASLTSKKMLSKIGVMLKESDNLMDAVTLTINENSIKIEMSKRPPVTLIGIEEEAAVNAILEGMGIASARINLPNLLPISQVAKQNASRPL